jgi:riboflavin kinase/FMN adenylyltransferase
MRLLRHYEDPPQEARGAVAVLGNFDGVHLGHRQVIADAGALAEEMGAPLAVITFEPHPRAFFRPDGPPFRLTSLRTKCRYLEELGADVVFALTFDEDFSRLTADEFIARVLVEGIAAKHVVAGYDFVFGHERGGSMELMAARGAEFGFGVTTIAPVEDDGDGEVYSSTRIRNALQAGKPRVAARLLGRPWMLDGRVEHGDRRGRTIGFATANIGLGDYLCPALGVYAVLAGRDPGVEHGEETQWLAGVANLGQRPTVGGEDVRLEVHLFDFAADLYGETLRVRLMDFIRPEKKFDGLDALKAQIALDCGQAREILAQTSPD